MREFLRIIKAVSDETKVRILKLLQKQKQQLCVCDIMNALNISQTRASRNLNILKNAGFVTSNRKGAWIYYSINKKKINQFHHKINEMFREILNNDQIIKEDQKRLKNYLKTKPNHPYC